MATQNKEKNDVVMLEHQTTQDEGLLKPIPMIEKVNYSGAYEVRSLQI